MLIFYFELPIEEGFEVLKKSKEDRLVRGRKVSACSGWKFFLAHGTPLRCWKCNAEADRWIVEKGQNDLQNKSPVLNPYALFEGRLVMINRDHIIPRSLGGTNDNANLRVACEVCNGQRGNTLTDEERVFLAKNPQLISSERLKRKRQHS